MIRTVLASFMVAILLVIAVVSAIPLVATVAIIASIPMAPVDPAPAQTEGRDRESDGPDDSLHDAPPEECMVGRRTWDAAT